MAGCSLCAKKVGQDVRSPGFEPLSDPRAMSALTAKLARFPLWAKIAAPVVVGLVVVSGVAAAGSNQGPQPAALPSSQSSTSVQVAELADTLSSVASVVTTTTLPATVPATIAVTVPPTVAATPPPTPPPTVATVPPTPPPAVAATVPPTEPALATPPVIAPSGTDPRFDTCKLAKANGYGPYVRGEDVEYGWYRDGDSDGTVCE